MLANDTAKRVLLGWVAGFLATLTAHQLIIALLAQTGLSPAIPYRMTPVPPFGVPAVLSLAFWGGVWGIVLAFAATHFPRSRKFWLVAFLFGAIGPPLVAWFVVAPMKGQPMAGGFRAAYIVVSMFVNGCWSLAAAWFLRLAKLA